MKRILKLSGALVCLPVLLHFFPSWLPEQQEKREFYQLTIYHFNTNTQQNIIDSYLKNALLPALHKMKIRNIGVFKNHANDTLTDKTVYVLVPVSSLDEITRIASRLDADKSYREAGAEYLKAAYSSPPFTRIETILLRAFSLAPKLQPPVLNGPRKERIYELRSYESATEEIFKNKVHMFNEGDEIGLFKRLNFNAAFYGEVVAGSKMPNLMYMTCHDNRQARDANWKNFVDDPYWKKLSSMPEYQHNVSHIDITYLYPADYSDY
ncbi:MAG TPA: NIPSNAP family protein [Chitinophagaceae bacterium]|nr:NIPSNAP family protein [Chitinophagaceae bacterium]